MKICIIKIGAIGDTIMTTPFTGALRQKFPKAQIDYYIGKRSAVVLDGNPNLSNVIPFDENIVEKKNLFAGIKLILKIRKENYDLGIILDKSHLAAKFLKMCACKDTAGFDRNGEGKILDKTVPYNNEEHEVDQYLNIAYLLGAKKITKPKIESYISKKTEEKISKMLKRKKINKFITIIPGGANNPAVGIDEVRRLPKKIWIETVKVLAKKHVLVFSGGPLDKDYNQKIINEAKIEAFNFAGELNIKESTILFKKSKLVICNDSGPMHMAGSVSKRMLVLFGATNPKRKAPRFIKVINIWKDQENYQPEFEFYGKKPKGKFMQTITKEEILEGVKKLL